MSLTKIHHIEHLRCAILRNTCKERSVCACGHAQYLSQMCSVMFYELDSNFLLLPQLQMAVDRGCYEEIGMLSYSDEIYDIAVHEGFGIAVGRWKVFEE